MAEVTVELGANRYGKSRVRLVKVTRGRDGVHELYEWNVQVLLQGDFLTAHTEGDNSQILPTDTMKNTVYSRAKESKAASMEEYAKELIDFLLGRNPQVSAAEVSIAQSLWKRVAVDGKPHPTTFMHGSAEVQTTVVSRANQGPWMIVSGLDGLQVLKTAKSGFVGYIKDDLTTLPETTDRLFGTVVKAEWTYNRDALEFNAVRETIRETLLRCFAEHDSLSVQQTLYQMGADIIAAAPAVDDIVFTLPNKHCLLVDLKKFGQENANEIFVPTDEPHGTIIAQVKRKK
ncbi:MAG TPA: urate oxidase [Acidobacteriaceae bacterium]